MALVFNSPSNNNAAGQTQGQERWKAKAFLNFWVRRADGSRAKIGAVPLKDSRNFDSALIERLQQEGGVEALMKHLEVDFQMAENQQPANVGF